MMVSRRSLIRQVGIGAFAAGALTHSRHAAAVGSAVTEWHVSPQGDDGASGTSSDPYATVERAQLEVRQHNADMMSDLTVYLHGGVHAIRSTLAFGPEDSGSNGHWVRYQNFEDEQPSISGGVPLDGWEHVSGTNIWRTGARGIQFRQLYVNGKRAVRAKSAEKYGDVETMRLNDTGDGFIVDEPDIAGWSRASDMELRWDIFWRQHYLKVESIVPGPDQGTFNFRMKQPYFDWYRTSGYTAYGPRPFGFYIVNAPELLDSPGEWYLDSVDDAVYYCPRETDIMTDAEVIVPQLERLVEIKGTLDEPVHHLEFKGITFRHGGWSQPDESGVSNIQAGIVVDGPGQTGGEHEGVKMFGHILVNAAEHVSFLRNRWEHMGGTGLVVENGASDVEIVGNIFTDLSGGAVTVGDMSDRSPVDPRQVTHDNTISNNVIFDVANEFWGSPGICGFYVRDLRVAHNEIYDLPYTGISVGWGWNLPDSGNLERTEIEANHVHHIMYGLMDGGGIYLLGSQPDSIVRRNVVHDQFALFGGVYLDSGSVGVTLQENITYDVPHDVWINPASESGITQIDNYWGSRPSDGDFPDQIAAEAGPELAFRDLLIGLPSPRARATEAEVGVPDRSDSVIIVNGKKGYTEEGTWATTYTLYLAGHDGYTPTRYSVSEIAGASWRPNLNAGLYAVSFFNVVHANSDPAAKVDVVHLEGTASSRVDQTTGPSRWVPVGDYYFGDGTAGVATLTRMTTPEGNGSGYARANAVRFVRLDDPADPADQMTMALGRFQGHLSEDVHRQMERLLDEAVTSGESISAGVAVRKMRALLNGREFRQDCPVGRTIMMRICDSWLERIDHP